MIDAPPVLSVTGLSTHFATPRGVVRAVEDVSFAVGGGETVALVGESGSGKSVTGLSILRLLPPSGHIVSGQMLFRGAGGEVIDLASAPERTLREVRGAGVSMVFQEPMSALNPVLTIGAQIAETIRLHQNTSSREAMARAEALLARVGVAEPARRLASYPHQLSGGMRQRAVIAMAVACQPALLIADEPTTALDVTTQAQVLLMLRALQAESGMGLLFVTHNLALVPTIADRVIVMYAGEIVEAGPAAALLAAPKHPYTRALLECLPARRLPRDPADERPLPTIEGSVPDLVRRPPGCALAERCQDAEPDCRTHAMALRPLGDDARLSRCQFAERL
jgi:oligopeptide/dipeptide ABC transporter ATP-binding protein